MSNEEMDQAILRLVKDRAEAKRSHAALSAELKTAAAALQALGQSLAYLDRPGISTEDPASILDRNADLLEPSKLARLIREHAALKERIQEMDRHAKGMGID